MEFALHNKWRHGKARFDLGQIDDRILSAEGIVPVSAVLDSSLGSEIVLLLLDPTPFVHTLAATNPFRLLLKTGVARTDHGPVMFFLFTVPDPSPHQPHVIQIDAHADPFNSHHMTLWRDLSRQSHWHLVLVGEGSRQFGFYEFENNFNLGASLDHVATACRGMSHGDFWEAKAEFSLTYSTNDLDRMTNDDARSAHRTQARVSPSPRTSSRSSAGELKVLAEDAFELAHELVAFQDKMNKTAGSFWGMFRTIDYASIHEGSALLCRRFSDLRAKIRAHMRPQEPADRLPSLLRDYSEALCDASGFLEQKTSMMLQNSRQPNSVSHSTFMSVARLEDQALQRCQNTGDKLTAEYRSL